MKHGIASWAAWIILPAALASCLSGSQGETDEAGLCTGVSDVAAGVKKELHDVAACSERLAESEGALRVLAVDSVDGPPITRYELRVPGRYPREVHMPSESRHRWRTGDVVHIRGREVECPASIRSRELGAGASGQGAIMAESVRLQSKSLSPDAKGDRRVAVLLVNFRDLRSDLSPQAASELLFGEVKRFFEENSMGLLRFSGDAYGPFTLDLSSGICDPQVLSWLALKAAEATGVDLSAYQHWMYVFPRIEACRWKGQATIGGSPSESWINGSFGLHAIAHELGHNLGLYHGKALECPCGALGPHCNALEYGDPTNVMGNQFPGHFSAPQKEALGWLNTDEGGGLLEVSHSGTFILGPYVAESHHPKALKIPRFRNTGSGTGTFFYLERRQSVGFDAILPSAPNGNLTNGVLVRMGPENSAGSSYLLNMNPQLKSWFQAALSQGQTFSAAESGIRIRLISLSNDRAELEIRSD